MKWYCWKWWRLAWSHSKFKRIGCGGNEWVSICRTRLFWRVRQMPEVQA